MQNVVAINAAARQSIIAAQATSDEMLLEGIAENPDDRLIFASKFIPPPFRPPDSRKISMASVSSLILFGN